MARRRRQRVIAAPHPDTIQFRDRLRRLAVGEQVAYRELSQLVGRDVQEHRTWQHLFSARRYLRRRERMVFIAIPNTAIKRLNDEEIGTDQMHYRRGKARIQTRLLLEEAACADMDRMTPDAARNLCAHVDVARRMEHFTRARFIEETKIKLQLNPLTPPPRIEA